MTKGSWPAIISVLLLLIIVFDPLFMGDGGDADGWTDGSAESLVYPHYGIMDMIADGAYRQFNASFPEKAKFLYYWYEPLGADSNPDSFDSRHTIPVAEDNFLAWTDDGKPDGDKANYFIHNTKGWEITDSPSAAQKWANYTIQNLTTWFMQGAPEVSNAKHKAAYSMARMSRYVAKMSQYGRTDYSQWDQVRQLPDWDPNEASYQEYYEALLWTDDSMESLQEDFWNLSRSPPTDLDAHTINEHTADVAKWVNSRDGSTVQMVDHDSTTITVGKTYKEMLDQFIYCWDGDVRYKDVRGFNESLWWLTIENLVAVTENLSAMYLAIYDAAWNEFLVKAPDMTIVDYEVMPEGIIANDLVSVNVTVRNDGPKDTPGTFIMELTASTGYVNTQPIQLDSGTQKNVSFTPFPVGIDPVYVTVVADSLETVAESDETDNNISFQFDPIPEIFASDMILVKPFPSIRKDTLQKIEVQITNNGNRYDEFYLNASTLSENIILLKPEQPIGVEPGQSKIGYVSMVTFENTDIGTVVVNIVAEGVGSYSDLQLQITILDRTQDPVPMITGPQWARLEEIVTLSAEGSTDPDGDSLSYNWFIPGWGNHTGSMVTFNYTKVGLYEIILEVYDGNATSTMTLPFLVFPKVPTNLSSSTSSKGPSGITVSWKQWKSGGLIAYWIEATALPGQGALSERGPYISRIGPGNNSGRVGKFLPGTDVEVKVTVEAERFGNVTLDVFNTNTSDQTNFQNSLRMSVDNGYLTVNYKPWLDPEGDREPVILVERWSNGYIPISNDLMEEIQKAPTFDTIRYRLQSNWGRYRAKLSYYWLGESISPFQISNETIKKNAVPRVDLSGVDLPWELNINGTCRVHLQMGINDPYDHLTFTIDWGDGSSEELDLYTEPDDLMFYQIFHNYSEIGVYDVSVRIEDWSGDVIWQNGSLEVHVYRPIHLKETNENIVLQIVLAVLGTIVLLALLIVMGYVGYKFSKKETEVDFDMDKLKSDISKQKPGTGTDFDQRRGLQIPKESIMIRSQEDDEDEEDDGIEEAVKPASMPIIKGTITFDDDDEE